VICGASSALVRVTSVLPVALTPAIEGRPARLKLILRCEDSCLDSIRRHSVPCDQKIACQTQAWSRSSYNKHRPRGGEPGVWRRRLTDVLGGVYLTDANIRQLLRHKQMSATIGVRCKQGTQQLTGEHIEEMRLAV